MPVYRTDAELIFRHPAFQGTGWISDNLSGEFDFSTEFCRFLIGWSVGAPRDKTDPYILRNFTIATRKGCYRPVLIDPLGHLTERGQKALEEARAIIEAIRDFYYDIEAHPPQIQKPEEFQGMDEILPYGMMKLESIRMLTQFFNLSGEPVDPDAVDVVPLPSDLEFPPYEFVPNGANEPVKCLLIGVLHSMPKTRPNFEKLLQYGLVELVTVPKFSHQKGRGRAPVGAKLTNMGKRFYQLYLDKMDPRIAKSRELAAELQQLREAGQWK
jgi:hypothetical protein